MGRSSIQKLRRLRRRSLYTLYLIFWLASSHRLWIFVFNFLLHTASPLFCALLIDANVDLIKLLARIGLCLRTSHDNSKQKRDDEGKRRRFDCRKRLPWLVVVADAWLQSHSIQFHRVAAWGTKTRAWHSVGGGSLLEVVKSLQRLLAQ